MTLSPTERKELLTVQATLLNKQLLAATDIDELATLELSTAAQLLGLSVTHAARLLPVIEVGPRTRRVTIAAYKAFRDSRTRQPAAKQ